MSRQNFLCRNVLKQQPKCCYWPMLMNIVLQMLLLKHITCISRPWWVDTIASRWCEIWRVWFQWHWSLTCFFVWHLYRRPWESRDLFQYKDCLSIYIYVDFHYEHHKRVLRPSDRVSSGQGKVREIPDLAKVREKSGNFVEGQGKNEYWEKSGNFHLVQSK